MRAVSPTGLEVLQRTSRLHSFLSAFASALLFLAFCPLAAGQTHSTARAHADRGIELAQSGNLEAADSELRQAAELDPNNPQLLAIYGTVLAQEKKYEASTRIFERALKINPRDATVRRYLAANLWQLHRFPEARANLEILLKAKPNDPPSRLLLGMVAENMGDYREAATMLASVPEQVRQQPQSIVALASSYYHLSQTEKARATLSTLIGHPAGAEGMMLGTQIADQMADYATAEKLLDRIQGASPLNPTVPYRLALVQYHAGKFPESQQTLERLIESGHATGETYNLLGWCYQQMHQAEKAIAALEESIRLAPAAEANYVDLTNILLASRKFALALETAKRGVTALPKSARACEARGLAETKMSQFTDAVSSYEHAVELDPDRPDALRGLAAAQAAAGMKTPAIANFEKGLKHFPKDAALRASYASALLPDAEAGDPAAAAKAERLLRAAIELNPSLAEAHYQLGDLYLKKGQTSQAQPLLEKAVKLDPQDSAAHFALARLYRRLGRTAQAGEEMAAYERLKTADASLPAASSTPKN